MKINRRSLLYSVAATAVASASGGWINGNSAQWKTLPLGAGGFIVGGDVASDGTIVCKTDTYNGYYWNASHNNGDGTFGRWTLLITSANFFSLIPTLSSAELMTGVWEIKIAPGQTTRFAMVFLNKVYRSDDRGATWHDSNLSMTNAGANSGGSRLANRKLCIDPNNPDHVFVGTPNRSTPNIGVYETFNFGNARPTWNKVTSIADPTFAPGCAGMVFDASSATITVRGHTVTSRVLISSAGNGLYETTDGGVNWTLTTGSPTAIWTAQIGPTGSYYCWGAANGATGFINVWRYVSSTWTDISPTGTFHGGNNGNWNGGTACVDPNNAGHLTVSAPNGGWFGYQTTKADAGSVAWTGSTGGTGPNLTANDIPWLKKGDTRFASVGDMVTNPADGEVVFFEGTGVWKFTSQVYDSASYNVSVTDMSLGIEQLVSNAIIAPLGASQPIYACWDRAVVPGNLPNYPTDYFPDQAVFGSSAQLMDCWCLDWASSDPSFIAALMFKPGPVPYSSFSKNYGAVRSWTKFGRQPTAHTGGCISAASPQNMIAVSAGNGRPEVPVYTSDGGASWSATDLPNVTWLSTFTLRSRILVADRVKIGTFYAYYKPNGLYKSTNGGVNFTLVDRTLLEATANAPQMVTVPGFAGELWLCTGNFTNQRSTLWHWRDSVGWTKIAACTQAKHIAIGATKPGASYPTLFLHGTFNGITGIFLSTDKFATVTNLTPNGIVNDFPTSCQLDLFTCMAGDMNNFGRCFIGANGSGAAYYTG
jgi:hypothetical protein